MAKKKLVLVWHELGWILLGEAALLGLILVGQWTPLKALAVLQALLGLAYVFFLPGYTLQAALYPQRGDLDGVERVALSFGLSVALVAPIALLLNALPWGIQLWTVVIAEALLLALFAFAAAWRRGCLTLEDRFIPEVVLDWRGFWAAQDRTARILLGVISAGVLLALGVGASIIVIPSPAEFFTEFYMLGPDGLAERYPRQVEAGEPVQVTLGVVNRERAGHIYRVEVWSQRGWDEGSRQLVGQAGPFDLKSGQSLEFVQEWRMPTAGKDQQALFFLYLDDSLEPYRSLRLWLDVGD